MSTLFSTDSSYLQLLKKKSSQVSKNDIKENDDDLQIDIEKQYDIDKTVKWINDQESNISRIALQFPDNLLNDSVKVINLLERRCENKRFFIMADTTFANCCIDEIGAEHSSCHAIVHYGNSCFSSTTRLPSLNIFGKNRLSVQDFFEKMSKHFNSTTNKILIFSNCDYHYIFDKLESLFSLNKKIFRQVECIKSIEKELFMNYDDEKETEGIYIGEEDDGLLHRLVLEFNRRFNWSLYDPNKQTFFKHNYDVRKIMMKRYHLIEKIKDAEIIGVLVGTLSVKNYNLGLKHLKDLIKKAGKKTYTFAMGKLNPAKLANFPEVGIFTMVACCDSSIFDSKTFYRPIVTPYEVELALNVSRNKKDNNDFYYESDYQELLPGASRYVECNEILEFTDVSLITGKLRSTNIKGIENKNATTDLSKQNLDITSINNAADFFSNRSWRGLEPKMGESEIAKIKEGRHGIALGYANELNN